MKDNKFSYKYYQYPIDRGMFPIGQMPVSLDYLGFYICEKGYVDIYLDNRKVRLMPNQICVVLPCSILGIEGVSDDFQGFGAKASILFMDELFIPNIGTHYTFVRNNPCADISRENVNCLKSITNLINHKLSQDPDPMIHQVAENLLNALAYEIISCYLAAENNSTAGNKSSRQDDIFRDFMSLVYRDHKKERGLSHYADCMCLTTRYLSSVVKEKTGHPASYWIENTVIALAKNLLRNSELSVAQISEELHFANASFFGQYFKKYAGVTPYDYRRGRE